ncbi:hypothetical protein CKO08_06955 [Halorhodospira halochloris]|nr:hypothetical protein [Halorhodospira halochloris]
MSSKTTNVVLYDASVRPSWRTSLKTPPLSLAALAWRCWRQGWRHEASGDGFTEPSIPRQLGSTAEFLERPWGKFLNALRTASVVVWRRCITTGLGLCVAVVITPAQGFESEQKPLESLAPLERVQEGLADALSNVVIRRTTTHLGDRFYREFSSLWSAHGVYDIRGVLTIEEQPAFNQGTLIRVVYERQVMFSAHVRPHKPSPEKVAEAAISPVTDRVAQRVAQRFMGGYDPDLAGEEL